MAQLNDPGKTLEEKLVALDCNVAALSTVQTLLAMCPPHFEVNANALGHLLNVLVQEFIDVQHMLDEPDAPADNE